MSDSKPFAIDFGALKSVAKPTEPRKLAEMDAVAERHGFVARETVKRPGRPPSPRTGQIHAKVYPHVSAEIAALAQERGTTQGVILEEAWAAYKSLNPDI